MFNILKKFNSKELLSLLSVCIILIISMINFQLIVCNNDIIISLLGTFIGFNVTAISIIATNKYSKELYRMQIPGKTYTYLDLLINYVKTAILFSFIIIILIIFFNSLKILDKKICDIEIFNLSILCIIFNFTSFNYLFCFSRKCVVNIRDSD